ncbi:MAG: 2,3-bisphosphoglycerate-independent phosphoglycerate mutase [Candidatus Marinimicrobia bacterium]|nr:2,3-bisphosphoglycerate-independent phosphoglycerate mutase [Candidatus Neomarinimicrobiota bacterium]MBL7023093.1 2,3-bisphosphoglycerate-independent phosphoglycerate mutase [Candidatus Neomarinimicrobiota bacterium]MBL7109113.1 2,3-bisphosphoglycerate-independent phosphoglycerate mutase [Candidatus Neomarinimicrobiota bacterium]
MLKFILIILDGFGIRDEKKSNAYALANTPNLDELISSKPMVLLETSGNAVGLPNGVMGNSEVGHTNIGAGRIVKQDLVRINDDIKQDILRNNPVLVNLFTKIKNQKSTLHLMGLISDGGVHSHIDHLKYIIKAAKDFGLKDVSIHAIMDGRDTPPNSGKNYIKDLQNYLDEIRIGEIASICGRYFTMDRDTRWDRVERGYRLMVFGEGDRFDNPISAIENSYQDSITDEFITPKIIGKFKNINNGDGVLALNFRADRMREISTAFTETDFNEFKTKNIEIQYVSMTEYQDSFKFPVLFPPVKLADIFPEVLSKEGYRQLRIAETEKYAHVTYFLNGGDEHIFPGEERIMIPSPKVATYDLQPEMSAYEVTEKVIDAIKSDKFETIILNYANPDMVGHTGILPAGIKAIEVVDECLALVIEQAKLKDATIFLTSDHGNLEMMSNPETGEPYTAHTLFPVPFIVDSPKTDIALRGDGKLADIAPTILDYFNLKQPQAMTGKSLLKKKNFN